MKQLTLKTIEMKKLFFAFLTLFITSNIQSQEIVPLLVDSQYYWSCYPYYDHFELGYGTNDCESFQGIWHSFSYDSNDRLILTKANGGTQRHSRTYSNDTIFQLNELLDTLGNWYIFSRQKTVVENNLPKSKLSEMYHNGEWINPNLVTYQYNNLGLETLDLRQNWINNEWEDAYKKECKYDKNGNKIEESEYYEYEEDNDTLEFSRGKLYEYDEFDHLIKESDVQSQWGEGRYIPYYNKWIYRDDQLLDSIIYYDRDYLSGEYVPLRYQTYNYSGNDISIENQYNWYNDSIKWRNDGKQITYKSGNVYNNNPDSSVIYKLTDSLILKPKIRYYYGIEELPDDRVYFKKTEYVYYYEDNDWSLTSLREEWYHKKKLTSIENEFNSKNELSIYPNPCKTGQNLYFQNLRTDNLDIEILIFDINGKFVSSNKLNNKSFIQAPHQVGMYMIMVRENDNLIGVAKQIVTK